MGRSPCCEKAHTNKGAWTRDEDEQLVSYIRRHGEGCWRSLPKAAGLSRCGKSCRLRWVNYLRPDLKRGNFTAEEDELIIKLHCLLGNKWSLIAGRMQGRTDNEIKNYWNTHIRRKLLGKGIDPATHQPLPQAPISDAAASLDSNRGERGSVRFVSREDDQKSDGDGGGGDSLPRWCFDLNLDLNLGLCVSPPNHEQSVDYSLGLSTGVLDFRSF